MAGYVNTGTVSLTEGEKTVTFADVSVNLFRAGNLFLHAGITAILASVDPDTNTAQLVDNWPGETGADQPYAVITIPESAELAQTTRRWNQYLNGPILSIAEMMGDTAPDAGETLIWDDVTGGWIAKALPDIAPDLLAGILATDDCFIQRKAGAIVERTPAQVSLDLSNAYMEADIASAATCDIGGVNSSAVRITGATAIASFGNKPNCRRALRFEGALLLTFDAAELITPTGANIQTAPGDQCVVCSDADGNWRVMEYLAAGGVKESIANNVNIPASGAPGNLTSLSLPPGKWRMSCLVEYFGSGGNGVNFIIACISTVSGSTAGAVHGKNYIFSAADDETGVGVATIPAYDISLSATTTVYLIGALRSVNGNGNAYLRAERII